MCGAQMLPHLFKTGLSTPKECAMLDDACQHARWDPEAPR